MIKNIGTHQMFIMEKMGKKFLKIIMRIIKIQDLKKLKKDIQN